MAAVHGKNGSVTFTNLTAGVRSWTWNGDAEAVESTSLADAGQRTYVVGLKGWNASVEANWDAANKAREGDSATLTLTAATGDTYVGTAIITSMSVSVGVGGVNTATYQFQGTGACTVTL